MALDPAYFFYSDGTITLTNGSDIVTGTFTSWETAVLPLDILYPNDGQSGVSVVKQVNSASEIQLAKPWTGPTLEDVPYFILRWVKHTDPKVYGVRVSEYLTRLKAIPENIEEVAGQIHADREAVDAALLALQQIQQEVDADRQAVDTAAGQVETNRQAAEAAAAAAQQALEDVQQGIVPDNSVSTVKVQDKAVTNPKLADMPAGTVKANLTEAASSPADVTLEALRDAMGAGQDAVYRGAEPFGATGFKLLAGARHTAHYGWGGIMRFASGKWVMVYRKAADHGITDGAELRAIDSYDKGETWENDRLLYSDPTHDARPDPPRVMANNRGGFFVNRQDVGTVHFSPLFFKTDDEGVTFTYAEATTTAPYTFQATGGIMDFPASQGGHDTLGFVSFGFLDAGGMDAFTTVNNGDTWTKVSEVANIGGAVTALSENWGFRVGNQDKWIFFSRAQDAGGWRQMMTVFVTTNLLNWGPPLDAGVNIGGGNPPGGFYDAATNKLHLLTFGRGGRPIDSLFDHHIMHIAADADALFNANGNFAALGLNHRVLAPVPNWATGYIAPFQDEDGKWWATFTCGEPGSAGGNRGMIALVGDFIPNGADLAIWNDALTRRLRARTANLHADTNTTTDYPLTIENLARSLRVGLGAYGFSNKVGTSQTTEFIWQVGGKLTFDVGGDIVYSNGNGAFLLGTASRYAAEAYMHAGVTSTKAAFVSFAGSTAARKHHILLNANGEAGSIYTDSTGAHIGTISDVRLKPVREPIKNSGEIIDAIEPIRNNWLHAPDVWSYSFPAQQVYQYVPSSVLKGDDDLSKRPGDDGFVQWQHDATKMVPILWAEVRALRKRVAELEARG